MKPWPGPRTGRDRESKGRGCEAATACLRLISFPDASAPSEDSRLAELCSLSVQSGLTEVLRTHEYIDSVIFWILLPQRSLQKVGQSAGHRPL